MSMSFLVDTTLCTACRGCQVACKQWHDLPAEETTNRGSYQNPADLSFDTYKLVRMEEEVIDGQIRWLFFPDQCRHCVEPPCKDTAGDESAIFTDERSGAVIYTANTKGFDVAEITESCPYNIPRANAGGTIAKCDMCLDRVQNGLQPACVKTCPTGAMNFGKREEILSQANRHLAEAKKKFPKAQLLDPGDVRVIFLTAYAPTYYHEFAVASGGSFGVTRHVALRRMLRPLTGPLSQLR
jgi:formate dehydrogenase iron-sulfur subunit